MKEFVVLVRINIQTLADRLTPSNCFNDSYTVCSQASGHLTADGSQPFRSADIRATITHFSASETLQFLRTNGGDYKAGDTEVSVSPDSGGRRASTAGR